MKNYVIQSELPDLLPQKIKKQLSGCEIYTFGLELDKAEKLDKTALLSQIQQTVGVVYDRVESYSSLKQLKKVAFVVNNGSDIISNQDFRIIARLGAKVGVYIILINNKSIFKNTLRQHFNYLIVHSEEDIEDKKGNYYNDT